MLSGDVVHAISNTGSSFSKPAPAPSEPGQVERTQEHAMSQGLIRKVLVGDDEVDLADLAEALLHCADLAMYDAKAHGRNRISGSYRTRPLPN